MHKFSDSMLTYNKMYKIANVKLSSKYQKVKFLVLKARYTISTVDCNVKHFKSKNGIKVNFTEKQSISPATIIFFICGHDFGSFSA